MRTSRTERCWICSRVSPHWTKRNAQSTGPLDAQEARPTSREDALAERLRILRSRSSDGSAGRGGGSQGEGGGPCPSVSRVANHDGARAAAPAQPSSPGPRRSGNRISKEKVISTASPLPAPAAQTGGQNPSRYQFPPAEAGDEDALDELLESLGDEDFDLASDGDLAGSPESDPSGDAKKVADLLESLQNNPVPSSKEDDDDDSDGEQMTRAVESLLSQLTDEVRSLPPPAAAAGGGGGGGGGRERESEQGGGGGPQQPQPHEEAVPGTAKDRKRTPAAAADPESAAESGGADQDTATGSSFALPTVPTQLVDSPVPHGGEEKEEEDDFEKDISARLASLRGLGPGSSSSNADDEGPLGLPSAPTFRPQDRRPSGKGGFRSSRFTDEDQKTWCVVCLEDATIRCVGCDHDVYCARCWREMHVGPAAGYDERGHKWVKFERNSHA